MGKLFRILWIILIMLSLVLISSCGQGGDSVKYELVDEKLPEQLKGLEIYQVRTSSIGYVNVGVINGKTTTSLTYQNGKTTETMILVDNDSDKRLIQVSEILVENDSIIVCRK